MVLVGFVWRREQQPPAIGELAGTLEDDDEDADDGARAALGLGLALAGIAIMATGGIFAVQGAERVVATWSVSDTAVGLTLVGLATSAELLALVWAAARRDVSELAVAAIVGSAAHNATATLGSAGVVHPAAQLDARSAAVLAAVLPLVVLGLGRRKRLLGRSGGVVLMACYVGFVLIVLL